MGINFLFACLTVPPKHKNSSTSNTTTIHAVHHHAASLPQPILYTPLLKPTIALLITSMLGSMGLPRLEF